MDNFSVLHQMFPQVDKRILRATLREDEDDLQKAIQFIRSEVLEEEDETASAGADSSRENGEIKVAEPEDSCAISRDMVVEILEQAKAEKEVLAQLIQKVDELREKADAADAALQVAKQRAQAAAQALQDNASALHKSLVQKRDEHATRAGEILSSRAILSMELKRLPRGLAWHREVLANKIKRTEQEGRDQMRLARRLGDLQAQMASIEQEFRDLRTEEVTSLRPQDSTIDDALLHEQVPDSSYQWENNAASQDQVTAESALATSQESVWEKNAASQEQVFNQVWENSAASQEQVFKENNAAFSQVWENNATSQDQVWDSSAASKEVNPSEQDALVQAWVNVKLSPEFVSTLWSQDYDDRELQLLVNSVRSLSNSVNANEEEVGKAGQELLSQSNKSSNGSWQFVEDNE